MLNENISKYKYLRIQGREIVADTHFAKGMFSMLEQLEDSGLMEDEDKELLKEIDKWVQEILPFPPQCQTKEFPVVCYFKTENSEEMLKLINPLLWLLDRYNQPYYLVYTNYPGEIVYEDQFQIAVKVYETKIVTVNKKVTGIKSEEQV